MCQLADRQTKNSIYIRDSNGQFWWRSRSNKRPNTYILTIKFSCELLSFDELPEIYKLLDEKSYFYGFKYIRIPITMSWPRENVYRVLTIFIY